MITHAAIKKDNIIYIGRRHCLILNHPLFPKGYCKGGKQGFVNDKGEFLDREQAGIEAISCGQIKELKYSKRDLFSEEIIK